MCRGLSDKFVRQQKRDFFSSSGQQWKMFHSNPNRKTRTRQQTRQSQSFHWKTVESKNSWNIHSDTNPLDPLNSLDWISWIKRFQVFLIRSRHQQNTTRTRFLVFFHFQVYFWGANFKKIGENFGLSFEKNFRGDVFSRNCDESGFFQSFSHICFHHFSA